MAVSLSLSAELYRDLLTHLNASGDEQVSFLFTEPPLAGKPLRVAELYAVPADGFLHQSPYHLALTDDVQAHVIGHAWQLGGCLIEVHSHEGGPPAWFSATDLAGFQEWVPHVRWRLRGRTYVALVFADESFDALVWEGELPGRLSGLVVAESTLEPTDITYAYLSDRS